MEYKGFKAKVEYSADDELFWGRLLGVDDIVTFEGKSVRELKRAMKDSVEFYLDICAQSGHEPRKKYSGKLLLRLTPELHGEIADAAAASGKSINEWSKQVFQQAVKG